MSERDRSRCGDAALEKTYHFLCLMPAVEKFPKSQKFLLGDRILNMALDVQESLPSFAVIPGTTNRRTRAPPTETGTIPRTETTTVFA